MTTEIEGIGGTSLGRPWGPWGHRWGRGERPWYGGWRGGGYYGPFYGGYAPIPAVDVYPSYVPTQRLVPRDKNEVAVCPGVTSIGKGLDRCANGSIVYDRTMYEERGGKLVRRGSPLRAGMLGVL